LKSTSILAAPCIDLPKAEWESRKEDLQQVHDETTDSKAPSVRIQPNFHESAAGKGCDPDATKFIPDTNRKVGGKSGEVENREEVETPEAK
jgi:hypothetical protein